VYNRGNDRQRIFFDRDNYLLFLRKVRGYLLPHAHLLSYCLMPNHFHFLLETRETLSGQELNLGIGTLLSSYTQAINVRYRRTGSLFQQHSKAVCLEETDSIYPLTCFHYIHQNPYAAGLVRRLEEWEYSSFRDYMQFRSGTLCDQVRARALLNLPVEREAFYKQSYQTIPPTRLRKLF
jgi:REP element-mobilizing transposase RayT